jgi:hypothetical protein
VPPCRAVPHADRALATCHCYLLLTSSRYTTSDAERAMLTALGVPPIPRPFDVGDLLAAVEAARSTRMPAKT